MYAPAERAGKERNDGSRVWSISGRTYDFARGDAHFWLTYPLPPTDLDLDPDPDQDFELDPDPAPDPHQNNADPQPWAQLSKEQGGLEHQEQGGLEHQEQGGLEH